MKFCLKMRIKKSTAFVIILLFTLATLLGGYIVCQIWGNVSKTTVLGQYYTNDSEEQTKLALAYYLNGDKAKAQSLCEKILAKNPNSGGANLYYGLILADEAKYKESIPYLRKGISVMPNQERAAYLYLGMSYYYTHNYDQAQLYLDESTKIFPGSPLNYYYLGLIAKVHGNLISAEALFNKAIGMSGGSFPEAVNELKQCRKAVSAGG